ncbi:MAG: hypothetical protein IJ677_03865 [Alphaproteobacteria bacterium]|nr:hypothetical protein [Alphaproteobacteria bacterium]
MTEVTIDYLNKERITAFERIENIEKDLLPEVKKIADKALSIAESKITTNEKLAQDSAINAGTAAKTASEKLEEINSSLGQIKDIIAEYKENYKQLRQSINIANDVNEKYDQIIKNEQGIADSQTKLKGFQAQIDSALTTAKQSEEKIKELETSSIGFVSKINELLNKSNELKAEISNIYDKIFGYDTKDENTGEIHHEEGLNDELNKSYKELRDQQNKLAKDIVVFQNEKEEEIKRKIELGNNKFSKLETKIKSLLPGAVTAGLSFAYKEKRESEETQKFYSTVIFVISILCLVAVSCIPVYINYHLYIEQQNNLQKVMEYIPNLFLFITPLYLPFLWLAWLSNKSAKLSKRLIEEYSYKEVLSKTYEGLNDKIQSLEDAKNSLDLKTKLLFNIVMMSSENPGKLITDYNKTDNPLMEILDKSSSLASAFDKFTNIPGLNRIAKLLDIKQQKAESNLAKKAKEGIDLQYELEKESE